jgi:flagellar biosynthesis/type III secretory pathway ATPase
MTLHRAIIITSDENSALLRLLDAFHASQTASHNRREELDALLLLHDAQTRIAEAHGLDPIKCSFGFSRRKDATWSVQTSYPLTPEEEERVRGLG